MKPLFPVAKALGDESLAYENGETPRYIDRGAFDRATLACVEEARVGSGEELTSAVFPATHPTLDSDANRAPQATFSDDVLLGLNTAETIMSQLMRIEARLAEIQEEQRRLSLAMHQLAKEPRA